MNFTQSKWSRAPRLLILLAAICFCCVSHWPARAQQAPADDSQNLEEQELEIDKQHFRKIFDAMQAYKRKTGDLPKWLSDLFPEYLSDPGVLMSPVEIRTHRSALWANYDPKMASSYIYEFSDADAGEKDEDGVELTMRRKKDIQMQEYGPVIPILRCHLHRRVLNLSYSGDIYQTDLYWEQDSNTRELMTRLGPGPGPKDSRKMHLTVVDAATGTPVIGADIQTSKMKSMHLALPPRDWKSDTNGQCEINLAAKEQPTLALRIGAAGYGTQQIEWTNNDVPGSWLAKLEKGALVGGIVRDPAGNPIPGVTVTLTAIQRNAAGEFVDVEVGKVTTDAAGKWTNGGLPLNFKSVTFELSQPDFRPTQYELATSEPPNAGEVSKADLSALSAIMVMNPAAVVTGVVTDDTGKALAGASVLFQQPVELPVNRVTNTDSAGRFRFVIAATGQGAIFAAAENFGPKSNAVTFDENLKPVTVKLSPGHSLKGRIIDSDKKPLAGVTVALQSWSGAPFPKWSTQTDSNGVFNWNAAPAESATYYFSKDGFDPLKRELPPGDSGEIALAKSAPARAGSFRVGMAAGSRFSGAVVDAQTKQPVPQFRITIGRDYGGGAVNWERYHSNLGDNGHYAIEDQQTDGDSIQLLAEASGYLPKTSPKLRAAGATLYNFELVKGEGPSGVVTRADGKPAAGVSVALITGDTAMELRDGRITASVGRLGTDSVAITDADGKFALAANYAVRLAAAGPDGYAEIPLAAPTGKHALTLQPWGILDCTVQNGSHPAAHQMVLVTASGEGMRLQYNFDQYKAQADGRGHLVISNVPPGAQSLVRLYPQGKQWWGWSHIQPLEIKSGEVTHVNYGGKGRSIIGKVTTSEPGRIKDWNLGYFSLTLQPPQKSIIESLFSSKSSATAPRYYGVQFGPDGSFRVDDVEAGNYVLSLQFRDSPLQSFGVGPLIGTITEVVEVPPVTAELLDQPIDLGTRELSVVRSTGNSTISPARPPAPDFEIKTLDGRTLRLRDFRGKYLILDFWAASSGPSVAELADLEDTWKSYGSKPGFAMLSLSLDADPATAQKLVEERGIKWTQGFLGERTKTALPDKYGVQDIPAVFLIGPAGRIVARDLHGPEIKAKVAQILGPPR